MKWVQSHWKTVWQLLKKSDTNLPCVPAVLLLRSRYLTRGFPGGPDGEESACSAGDPGSTPGSGRSPGVGNDNPLQYSCLGNPMDRIPRRATVHKVAKSQHDRVTKTFSFQIPDGKQRLRYTYTYIHGSITHNSQRYKPPKRPSADEWINKMWSVHMMERYSAMERMEVLIRVAT